MGLLSDPTGTAIWPIAIMVGAGMMSGFLSSQALIGEASPAEIRGSVIGLFSLSGAIGILFVTKNGGFIYDEWLRSGPFLMTGTMAMILALWALRVRRTALRETDPRDTAIQ